MHESRIDLSLAVNYLPACACLAQSAALSVCLCFVHTLQIHPAFAGLCLVLAWHRIGYRARILDGSSVLFGVFLSHWVATARERADVGSPAIRLGVSVEWSLLSGYFLVQSGRISESSQRASRWPFAVSCIHVAVLAFVEEPLPEPRVVRLARDVSFAFACVSWMYVIGIYRKRLAQQAAESALHFAGYFWPLLYSSEYVAAVYFLAVLVSIALHLRPPEQDAAYSSAAAAVVVPDVTPRITLEIIPDDAPTEGETMEDLEKTFRMALQSAKAGTAL